MKRIYRTGNIIASILTLLIFLALTGYLIWIAWEIKHIAATLSAVFYLGLFLFMLPAFVPKAAYRIEYDDEKIISRNIFKKDVTIRKDKDIYYSEIHYKGHTKWTISNEPFFFNSKLPKDFPSIELHDNEFEQSVKPAHCISYRKVDWDLLIDHYSDKKAAHADNDKIYMLPGFLWELVGLELSTIALTVSTIYFVYTMGMAGIFLFLFTGIAFWIGLIVAIVTAVKRYRFCAAISFSETAVTSSLFKKEQCTVDLTQTVYYAVFRGAEYYSEGEPYVVISNAWFNYFKVNQEHRSYLSEFDPHTQIAFPYNAESALYCSFDTWHCVGGFAELSIRRRSDSSS